MVAPVFTGQVIKGKLKLDNQPAFLSYLFTLNERVQVIVRKPKKDRSTPQNRYYWGVCIKLLADHTGYSPEEMHDALRLLFLLDREKKVITLKSTTELSTVEFEEYMTKVRNWASSELSVYIPEPNEVEL